MGTTKSILIWATSSVIRRIVVAFGVVCLPLFVLGMWANIRAGYPTADLGELIMLSLAGGLIPGLLIWLFLTAYVQLRQRQSTQAARPTHSINASVASISEPTGEARIRYHWHYDADYYSMVMKRYYGQLPRMRQPATQYTLLWLAGLLCFAVAFRPSPLKLLVGGILVGAVAIPAMTALTKIGIKFRYLMRPSFKTEADLFLSSGGITISQKSLNGTYPWTTYAGAVRFHDGIMLLKRGGIRWLPDAALVSGTSEDAMQLVRTHLAVRIIE
jgi:hypothetical protein